MAKIDELHNYAYPNKYLDELHIYDKSLGSNGFDEVHNYGNRGVTYGMDELHLYGSYQTVEEDEVNKPSPKYEVIDIDEYFDEIEVLDEQQKEERKELANEFKDIMTLIFALMLADLRVGNELNEGFYHSLAKSRLMDAVDRKMPYLTADIYVEIENYINQNLNYVIETTINHSGEPYTFSEARATSLAVDDSLASFNIEELEEAIKAGYKYKIWKAMDDNKVRLSHQKVDGKKVKIKEPFEVGRCLMQAPMIFDEKSHFQDAKEVVNCRCQLIYSFSANNREEKQRNINPESQIKSNIQSRTAGYGRPADVSLFDAPLTKSQQALLDKLPDYDSRTIVKKRDVSMRDLASLSAKTGVEFGMFTKGKERLIIRGDSTQLNIFESDAKELKAQGYKFSGHTHPTILFTNACPSGGDRNILKIMGHRYSSVYNSAGKCYVYGISEEYDIGHI